MNPKTENSSRSRKLDKKPRGSPGPIDFGDFYDKFAPRIRALAIRQIADRHLAEDVVQETFLKVYRYPARFDTRRPAWPWLSAVATNACRTILKRVRPNSEILVSPDDAETSGFAAAPELDPAEWYCSLEDGEIVLHALKSLSSHYRRVLLLKDEGWHSKDIAAAEGTSVESTKGVLKRARQQFREAYQAAAEERGYPIPPSRAGRRNELGLVLPAFVRDAMQWARRKIDAAVGRIRQAGDAATGSAIRVAEAGTSTNWIATGVLLIVLGAGSVAGSSGGAPSGASDSAAPALAMQDTRTISAAFDSPPARPGPSPAGPVDGLTLAAAGIEQRVTDPSSEATPENTSFYNMAASPDYENDHTVFASGDCSSTALGPCNALFVSQDGGASWRRLAAQGFLGASIGLLPSPTYSRDGSIFSVNHNYTGLQRSADRGSSFQPVLPLAVEDRSRNVASIFSAVDAQDTRLILVTHGTVLEYSDRENSVKPMFFSVEDDYWGAVISPAYERDHVSLLIAKQKGISNNNAELNRCEGLVCRGVSLRPVFSRYFQALRFSPRFADDGIAYAHISTSEGHFILASSDGARTFRQIAPPREFVWGIFVSQAKGGQPTLWAASFAPDYSNPNSHPSPNEIFRLNQDDSWSPMYVPGIAWPTPIGSTPTGRLFVAGSPSFESKGIACSSDGGLTWQPRCSPE